MSFKQKLLNRRKQYQLTLITFSLIMLVFATSLHAENWRIILTAESGEHMAEVSFGVANGATDDYDIDLDVASAPASPGTSLSLNFSGDLTDLKTDIRGIPDSPQIIIWDLKIITKAPGNLRWNVTTIPTDWNIRLGQTDMHTSGEMDFALGNSVMTIEATYSTVVPVKSPTIAEVTPNIGSTAGGLTIAITGANFQQGAEVMVSGKAATDVNVTSSTSITAKTPAAVEGIVEVTVTNPDGQSVTLSTGFTYTSEEPPPTQKGIWTVVLTAKSGDNGATVSFGVAKDATDDYDVGYDVGLAPSSPDPVPLSVSFENELTPFETDIRGSITSSQKIITWTLNIDSDAQGRLSWDTKELPTGWSLTIKKVDIIAKIDMRTVGEMSFDQGHSTMTITAATPTDVNSDGKVDISDLVLAARNLGERDENIEGDVNGDGEVNISDLALVAEHFGFFTP